MSSNKQWRIKGLAFDDPCHFLQVDDYDILNGLHKPKSLRDYIQNLKYRILPKVALVLAAHTVQDEESMEKVISLSKEPGKLLKLRNRVAKEGGLPDYEVHFDFPRPPDFQKEAIKCLVRVSNESTVSLDEIYPTSGWVTAYSQNRFRAYVFSPRHSTGKIARIAARILRSEGILLKRQAFSLAKHEKDFLDSKGITALVRSEK